MVDGELIGNLGLIHDLYATFPGHFTLCESILVYVGYRN